MTLPRVSLDWAAYWDAFQQAHGGNPIPFKGRFLFADGWTYGTKSHSGPEWPPPDDPVELRELQRAYWAARRGIVDAERHELSQRIEHLIEMQSVRTVPLQQAVRIRNEDGSVETIRGPLDLDAMLSRLGFLEDDVKFCDSKLEELTRTEVKDAS